MAHKLKEQTDYYKEKTEARQSICYIIINKNESYSIRQIHSQDTDLMKINTILPTQALTNKSIIFVA